MKFVPRIPNKTKSFQKNEKKRKRVYGVVPSDGDKRWSGKKKNGGRSLQEAVQADRRKRDTRAGGMEQGGSGLTRNPATPEESKNRKCSHKKKKKREGGKIKTGASSFWIIKSEKGRRVPLKPGGRKLLAAQRAARWALGTKGRLVVGGRGGQIAPEKKCRSGPESETQKNEKRK